MRNVVVVCVLCAAASVSASQGQLQLGKAIVDRDRIEALRHYRVGQDAPLIAVVNPELAWSSEDEETAEEGCLSLPGVAVDVDRPVHVRVRAQDGTGDPILIEASGLEARVLQHEMDHLDGTLIIDRIPKEQRKEALRILREGADALEPRALRRDGERVAAG